MKTNRKYHDYFRFRIFLTPQNIVRGKTSSVDFLAGLRVLATNQDIKQSKFVINLACAGSLVPIRRKLLSNEELVQVSLLEGY